MKTIVRSARPLFPGRRIFGRAQRSPIIDPYRSPLKPHEPTACPQCLAVYHHGRWEWSVKPTDAKEDLCPACRRINDKLPAGIVTLHGAFSPERAKEVAALARHEEGAEREEHPLNRIMAIEERSDGLAITTTDVHLPRRIGEAVKRTFHGELTIEFDDTSYFVRVDWRPPQ